MKGDIQMLNEQQIREIKSDVNYSVSQLLNHIDTLQDEVDYLKGQNKILKERLENEA